MFATDVICTCNYNSFIDDYKQLLITRVHADEGLVDISGTDVTSLGILSKPECLEACRANPCSCGFIQYSNISECILITPGVVLVTLPLEGTHIYKV